MSTPGEKSPYPPLPNNSEPRQVWADSSPAQGWTTPPPAYHETYPHLSAGGPPAPGVNIVHVVHPVIFGDDPVQTMCNHCGSNVVTVTSSEAGLIAWVFAAVLCAVGFWCCAPLPLCSDSMQDVTHRCPACNRIIAKIRHNL